LAELLAPALERPAGAAGGGAAAGLGSDDSAAAAAAEKAAAAAALGLPPLAERTYLVTGATSGIGRYTAELLAKAGCMVLVHGRYERRVLSTMRELGRLQPGMRFDGFQADFSMMSEVRELAEMVANRYPVIHGVLHNAATINGKIKGKKQVTREDNEHSMAVNALAPFLLTSLLMENVRASGAGRFVFSSSASMGGAKFLNDLRCERDWSGIHAYSLSKLCNSMVAAELHERFGCAPRLCFHAIDPGLADTKLMRFGASWGKGKGGRQHRKSVYGLLPNVRTANASFQALTENSFQEVSGLRVAQSAPEVHDAAKRDKLWEDFVCLTGATWPVSVSTMA